MSERLIASLMKQTRLLSQAGASLSDAVLVEKFVSSRDEAAFTALVHRHGPMVWAVCRNALPGESDAEDAFQATFLALVQHAGKLVRTAAVGAWLHSAAVRICLMQRRSKRRRIHRETRVARTESAAPHEPAWSDELVRAHRAIGQLPRREHEVFVLCVLEGMSQPLVARRLGLKPNTVSGLIARAAKRLRAQLTSSRTFSLGALAVAASCPAMLPAHLLNHAARLASTSSVSSSSILLLSSLALESAMRKVMMFALVTVVLGTGFTATRWFLSSSAAQEQPTSAYSSSGYGQQSASPSYTTKYIPLAQGWEYKTVLCSYPQAIEGQLNPLGSAGWELSTTTAVPNSDRILLVLKRQRTSGKVAENTITEQKVREDRRHATNDQAGSVNLELDSAVNTIELKHASAPDMALVLRDIYKSAKVSADTRTNTLIIQAPEEVLGKLKQLIEKLDASNSKPK